MNKTPIKAKKKDKTSVIYSMKESKELYETGEKEYKKYIASGKDAKKQYMIKARECFLEAVNKWQENHEAQARLAEIYIELNDNPEAYKHIIKAIHYNQKNAKYHYIKGKIHFKSGQWEEALREFKEANAESINEKEIVYLFMIGESYFQLAKYNEAIEQYRETEKAIVEYEEVKGRVNRYLKESKDLADVNPLNNQ